MRNAFIEELVQLAKAHPEMVLVVGDLGFSVIEPFIERFPGRFINAGVAEQNMTGLAAGLASEGHHVLTYSIANFPTFRCAEQIRNDVDYLNLPVTVVAVGGGLSYGPLGYSHHAVQDMALMRLMPNMMLATPGDPAEVRACLRYLAADPGPSYLRLNKAGEKTFHNHVPILSPGLWLRVKASGCGNAKHCFLTAGASLQSVMIWAEDPAFRDFDVYSLPLWGMETKGLQMKQAACFDTIVTVEDHFLDGGFGSWLREALAAKPGFNGQLHCLGLQVSVRNMVGTQDILNAAGGLTLENAKKTVFGERV